MAFSIEPRVSSQPDRRGRRARLSEWLGRRVFGLSSVRSLLAGLGVVEGVLIGVWWGLGSASPFVKDWFPNLGTELAAVIFALVVVDAVVRRERRRRLEGTRATASNAIVVPLLPLIVSALREAVIPPRPGPPFEARPEHRDARFVIAAWL